MWRNGVAISINALEVGDVILEIFGQEVEDKKAYIDASKRAKLSESQPIKLTDFG